jgi:hypothetical protein
MNSRTIAVGSALVVVGLFVLVTSATPIAAKPSVQQSGKTFEYAQLIVKGDAILNPDNAEVLWYDGDRNLTPNYVSISTLNKLLSRRALRPTLANLLNTIGGDGWEMISVVQNTREINTWTFKREL